MNPFLTLLALLFAAPVLFNSDRPIQARVSVPVGDLTSPQSIVEAKLLEPLQKKDAKRSSFSRAAPPPSARRVRILDQPRADAKGQAFVSFAIDETHSFRDLETKEIPENDWHRDTIVGCVYPQSGEVIVKLGEAKYPASVLWGESVSASPAGVCRQS